MIRDRCENGATSMFTIIYYVPAICNTYITSDVVRIDHSYYACSLVSETCALLITISNNFHTNIQSRDGTSSHPLGAPGRNKELFLNRWRRLRQLLDQSAPQLHPQDGWKEMSWATGDWMNARLVFKLSEDGFRSEPHRRLPKTIRMFGERSFCSRRYNFNLSAVCIGTRPVHSEQSLQDKTNIVKDPPDQTFQKMLVVSAIALTKSHCICARGLCFRYLCQGHLLCFTFLLIRASA